MVTDGSDGYWMMVVVGEPSVGLSLTALARLPLDRLRCADWRNARSAECIQRQSVLSLIGCIQSASGNK